MEDRRNADPMIAEMNRRMIKLEEGMEEVKEAVSKISTLTNHVEDFLGIVENINNTLKTTYGEHEKRIRELEIWKIRADAKIETKASLIKGAWKDFIAPIMVLAAVGIFAALYHPQVNVTSAPIINPVRQ